MQNHLIKISETLGILLRAGCKPWFVQVKNGKAEFTRELTQAEIKEYLGGGL